MRVECKRDRLVTGNESTFHDIKCIRLAFENIKNGRNILHSPDTLWRDFEAKFASNRQNIAHFEHGRGIADLKHDCQPTETGENLTQEFESLTGSFGSLDRQSRDVAARPRKA